MKKVRKENLTPIRIEDYDIETLRQFAREGRLYIEVDDVELEKMKDENLN